MSLISTKLSVFGFKIVLLVVIELSYRKGLKLMSHTYEEIKRQTDKLTIHSGYISLYYFVTDTKNQSCKLEKPIHSFGRKESINIPNILPVLQTVV